MNHFPEWTNERLERAAIELLEIRGIKDQSSGDRSTFIQWAKARVLEHIQMRSAIEHAMEESKFQRFRNLNRGDRFMWDGIPWIKTSDFGAVEIHTGRVKTFIQSHPCEPPELTQEESPTPPGLRDSNCTFDQLNTGDRFVRNKTEWIKTSESHAIAIGTNFLVRFSRYKVCNRPDYAENPTGCLLLMDARMRRGGAECRCPRCAREAES